ncbi:hypothetical protein J9A28_24785 [Escherichia coli]|nr:hypothetical protein [Escherichia coli]
MTTFTDKELIKEIKERISSLDVRGNIERRAYEIALASLEAEPVAWMRDDADGREYNARNEFSGGGGGIPLYATPQVQVVPEEMYWQDAPVEGSSKAAAYATGWNDCREAMLQSGNFRENKDSSTNNFRKIPEASTSSPVTPALLPGGFTIEEAKELHEDLVRSHISKALSGEKMKKKDRDADLRWIHGVIVQAAWFVKASLEQNALSGNSRLIPGEVLSAIQEVAKIRADFDDFDGDRRGIGDCLDEAEQELIVTINKYASQLAAEPIATNDVREQQTAVPPIQADVAQAIENLKQKLVECNRYNYCADAVKGVEDACHAAMLQGSQPVSQTYKLPVNTPCQDAPAHIWLQTAGVWPEDGELSELTWCSHNQHHDDTLYVRADLVNGNSPVTPDGWISCSERMPDDRQEVK